jgi:hypothetical protein
MHCWRVAAIAVRFILNIVRHSIGAGCAKLLPGLGGMAVAQSVTKISDDNNDLSNLIQGDPHYHAERRQSEESFMCRRLDLR